MVTIDFVCRGCGTHIVRQEIQRHPYKFCSQICRNKNYGPTKRWPEHFWEKVNKTDGGCWLWTASIMANGYGCVRRGGKTLAAHSTSWRLTRGEVPAGLFVLHRCDVRACVNPDHLFLGTAKDNSEDMVAKGRHASKTRPGYLPCGEAHPATKVSAEVVLLIRRRHLAGEGIRQLAAEVGMSYQGVWGIVRGKTWRHIDARA